ncbi:flavin reductase family protein [Plantactinospora endophytica]|uniref:FMN reductase n=1 Tax=Plantactinospora endophytica TaxID=673535 RepID=A0ABQ4EBM4_9ACTN|nr:flavin reductase family protein [Plantactinospora endophytica]GIG92061.1 FMN reductase [Plantactinospora endophytica]
MTETVVSDPIDQRRLRTVLGHFTTGVVVVTAVTPDGRPTGMTANSFSSLSLDPPLVLFCVNRHSRLFPVFASAPAFAVNVLRERDRDLSQRFARPGLDRFGELTPRYGRSGAPLLDDPLAVLECVAPRRVPAGDHEIVIGRVVEAWAADEPDAEPLVYYGGAYRTLHPDRAVPGLRVPLEDPLDWWVPFR